MKRLGATVLLRLVLLDRRLWLALALALVYSIAYLETIRTVDSDASWGGITTLRILDGDFRVFSAASHIGALQAYLDVVFVWIFGVHDWVLKISPLIFHLVHIVLMYAWARLLVSKREAMAAALIVGLPGAAAALIAHTWVFSLFISLWIAALLAATWVAAYPSRARLALYVPGFCWGLAFWMTPQSLVLIAPALSVFFLFLLLRVRLLRSIATVLVPFIVGSLPWWYYNLVTTSMGTFRDDPVTAIAPGIGLADRLSIAVSNGRFFLFQEIPRCLDVPAPNPLMSGTDYHAILKLLGLLVLLLWAIFGIVWLVRTATVLITADREHFAAIDRRARITLFTDTTLLGVFICWLLGIGFSAVGANRGDDERFVLPVMILLPVVLARVSFLLARGRRWVPCLLTAVLLLPPFATILRLPKDIKRADQNASFVCRVSDLCEQRRATFLAGDYWDVRAYSFRTRGQVVGVSLDEKLQRVRALDALVPPLITPRYGPGYLVVRRGGRLEQSVLKSEDEPDWERIPGIDTHRLLYLDTERPSKIASLILRTLEQERRWSRFVAGFDQEILLNDYLHTQADTRVDSAGSTVAFATYRPGPLVFGPYLPLPGGEYEVTFVFPPAGPNRFFTARADIAVQLGAEIWWWRQFAVGSAASRQVARFSVPARRNRALCETRVFVTELEGYAELSEVRLKRVYAERD